MLLIMLSFFSFDKHFSLMRDLFGLKMFTDRVME